VRNEATRFIALRGGAPQGFVNVVLAVPTGFNTRSSLVLRCIVGSGIDTFASRFGTRARMCLSSLALLLRSNVHIAWRRAQKFCSPGSHTPQKARYVDFSVASLNLVHVMLPARTPSSVKTGSSGPPPEKRIFSTILLVASPAPAHPMGGFKASAELSHKGGAALGLEIFKGTPSGLKVRSSRIVFETVTVVPLGTAPTQSWAWSRSSSQESRSFPA
jgi:hypothetical protein